jgi:hypothetical protein
VASFASDRAEAFFNIFTTVTPSTTVTTVEPMNPHRDRAGLFTMNFLQLKWLLTGLK